ncbi:glycosyltransferase family 4 protein [Megasphaera paucivorans]|uniref:Glycosyltransferase involved in cell wall bisynthesis n=1 Tax=Megasphaera paucivorans TaxID=349095 RepID=A0A1G9W0H1_9FIRM|nr:glycosyltransferase family 4 protein [Megasphaera paucivorans]SDM78049.1 Glycosyltransferase involved in cell wall bisynthesis [Megasphaera paucivorans]
MNKICYITTISDTIQAFFVPQLQYLSENGFSVTVVCSPDDELKSILGDYIQYHPIMIPRGIATLSLLISIYKLRSFFIKERFDIVQYSTPNAAFCSAIAAKLSGIRVRNYHLMGLRYLGASGIFRIILKQLEKYTCECSTHIECVSKSNLELAVQDKLFSAHKGTVIWNGSSGGIDLSRFDISHRQEYRALVRKKYGILEHDFLFGFMGRITVDKGINEIFEAFSRISNAKLMIIGPTEQLDFLNQYLFKQTKKNHNIIFIGQVSDPERFYCAMDVLLLPSYREGFGNVVIEAAAMGTPAIVSDIPGPIDTSIQNVTALWVPPKDVHALEESMKKIINKPGLRSQLSKACRPYVIHHFEQQKLNAKILERKKELLQ